MPQTTIIHDMIWMRGEDKTFYAYINELLEYNCYYRMDKRNVSIQIKTGEVVVNPKGETFRKRNGDIVSFTFNHDGNKWTIYARR